MCPLTNPGRFILELWSDVAPNSSLVTHDISVTLPTNTETANVQVRATLTVQMTACESCGGLYVSNVTGAMSVWDIRLDADGCLVPDSEYSYTSNWNAGIPTAHDFGAAISNSQGTNFARRTVEERDPGGGGPDSCYWDGSLLDPQTTISGGAWPVGTSNQYGYDTVGWPPSAVEYIRENRRDPLPCETQFPQQMVINCGASTTAYRTNTLRMGIDTNTVFSERDGVYISRSWP